MFLSAVAVVLISVNALTAVTFVMACARPALVGACNVSAAAIALVSILVLFYVVVRFLRVRLSTESDRRAALRDMILLGVGSELLAAAIRALG